MTQPPNPLAFFELLKGINAQPDPNEAMAQPMPSILQQPTPQAVEPKQDNPLDAIIQGLLANPPKESAMEPPDQYIGRRVSEMVHGPQGPPQTKKGKAVAFLENILTGAAAGPKYIPPALRAREYAEREYQLHQTNERARIQEARSAWMQQIAAAQQARLALKDEEVAEFQRQLAGVKKQDADTRAKTGEAKIGDMARKRIIETERLGLDWAKLNDANKRTLIQERMAAKGDPEDVLAQIANLNSRGIASDEEYDAAKEVYKQVTADRLKQKATSSRVGRVGNWKVLEETESGNTIYFDPNSGTIVKPPDGIRARRPTATELKASNFYDRGTFANQGIEALEEAMTQKGLLGQAWYEYMPNWTQSEDNQQYRILQRVFTEAHLRKESGAVITKDEMKQAAQTYFPQPGDSPETLAQKRLARYQLLEALKKERGSIVNNENKPKAGAPFAGGAGRAASPTATPTPTPATPQAPKINPATGRRVVKLN